MNETLSIRQDQLTLIGAGRRRYCYRLADTDRCVKFYRRLTDQPLHRSRARIWLDVTLGRHIRPLNINYREWRYHQRLQRALPPEVMALFPEHTDPVFCPENGWGIAESLILNVDGSLPQRVHDVLRTLDDPALAVEIYRAVEQVCQRLAEHAICFFDIPNILLQWTGARTFRLRIADFEPQCRALLPGLASIRPYVRCKVRRRTRRYLERLRGLLRERGAVLDTPVQAAATSRRSRLRIAHTLGLI